MRANYEAFQKVKAEKDALEEQVADKNKRAAIATELQNLHDDGLVLRAQIIESSDESPVDIWQEGTASWRDNLFEYLRENVSAGKAKYVDSVTSVARVNYRGMKSYNTRQEKAAIVALIDERLKRLVEVMREY
jgi:hypothetical protein